MRTILKGREPVSLAEYRSVPGARYDDYRDKQALRASLAREQRGLCCYCLSRLRPQPDAMKIEHWHCQAGYRAEQLEYSNLLGSCMGNEGSAEEDQHCDTKKAKRDLSRNPANPAHRVEDVIRFGGDGRIFSTEDPVFNTELSDVLNLNLAFLRSNRKETLTAFTLGLAALNKRGKFSTTTLEKWLVDWSGEGHTDELRPFCQVVVYWLRKKLARS